MKQDIKERWLKALRSGAFRQGRGRLRQCVRDGVTRHCCLGVLGEILAPSSKWTSKAITNDGTNLRGSVLAELGLTFEHEGELVGMNDGERRTFEEIADWIERKL